MHALISFLTGGLFGAGLLVSGMTDTIKVQGWLDYFSAWNPTLAFVLGGAIMSMLVAWRIAAKRETAVLGNAFPIASPPILDRNLIGGAALFGFGWAVVGLCPGPAMALLAWGGTEAIVFFVAMVAGMTLNRLSARKANA